MSGGWVGSTRKQHLPADWHARRAACYRNAQGRCANPDQRSDCAGYAPLHKQPDGTPGGHADHINRAGPNDQTNLQWLCPGCHKHKTTREGNAARPRQTRPAREHPGLVY